jgi:ribosome biogenesis GTPase / thiamine phosphate phosphatase
MSEQIVEGLVVVDFGRDFLVQVKPGEQVACTRKGKRHDVACGDRVRVRLAPGTEGRQGSIEAILDRTTLLFRSDQWKEKTLAANIDQAIIIAAPKPTYSETFINLCLVACEAANVKAIIAMNKSDLVDEHAAAMRKLQHLADIGYTFISMSAKHDIAQLTPLLEGQCTLLVGQSGMGKSKTINALVLDDVAREGELSDALDSGKHTTTFTRLYHLPHIGARNGKATSIIDSPGFQSFGLLHVGEQDLAWSMPEFRPYLGQCKFNNCAHLDEPGCAVNAAHKAGKIQASRLAFYQALLAEHRESRAKHPEWKR